MTRLLRSPAFHFTLLGAVLYLTQPLWNPTTRLSTADDPERLRIVISPTKLGELRGNFRKLAAREPDDGETLALVKDYVDREILYREAILRGLDRGDRSVRFRLIQKMQFLEGREDDPPEELYEEARELGLDRDDLVIRRLLIEKMRLLIKLGAVREKPDEETLEKFYETNAEDYRQPARVSLHHVFLSSDKRRDTIEADATTLLEEIRAENLGPQSAIKRGDVFPLGHHPKNSSKHNLAKLFGPNFAEATADLEPGGWYGPIRSAYGLHLVWVDDRTESRLPGLEPVRNQIEQRYLAELREAEFQKAMKELRQLYAVIVQDEEFVWHG